MAKAKIKKRKAPFKVRWAATPLLEKIILFIPVLVCVGLIAWVAVSPKSEASEAHANRELLLTTAGNWETFEEYGLDVWCPSDIAEESAEESESYAQKLFVTRDKGKYPEISYGVLIPKDVDGRSFDIANDISGVMDVVTPLLNEAFASMINGAYPTITSDIDTYTLPNGEPVLRGEGEATVTLVLQDALDETEQWAEETTVNLYYNVVMFYGRPIVVWGTWDYSTYEGRNRVVDAVTDGIVSLLRTEDTGYLEPLEDPVINSESENEVISSGDASAVGSGDSADETTGVAGDVSGSVVDTADTSAGENVQE